MPPKKNTVLPQSKNKPNHEHLKNNIKDMFTAMIALQKCLGMKCKIEQEKLKKSKFMIEIEKLMLDFQKNLKNGKVNYKKFNNDVAKLKIKAMKEKEREELVKCQLNNCYNETLHMMKISLESMVNNGDKKSKEYKLALKYKKILDTNKLTAEHLNTLDIEMMKIKLNKM
jgi:hypothetical protein